LHPRNSLGRRFPDRITKEGEGREDANFVLRGIRRWADRIMLAAKKKNVIRKGRELPYSISDQEKESI